MLIWSLHYPGAGEMLFEGAHSDEAGNEADDEGCGTPNEDHGWGEDVPHGVGVFGAFHLGFNVGEIVVGVNKSTHTVEQSF